MGRRPKTEIKALSSHEDLDRMTEALAVSRNNNKLYKKQSEDQKGRISDLIAEKMILLSSVDDRGKVNLRDPDAVKACAMLYLESCRRADCMPTFEGFSVALGYSRFDVYYVMRTRKDATVDFLNLFRTAIADITQTASYKRLSDNATSIFILKNSGLGFSDHGDEKNDTVEEMIDDHSGAEYYRKKYGSLIDQE